MTEVNTPEGAFIALVIAAAFMGVVLWWAAHESHNLN